MAGLSQCFFVMNWYEKFTFHFARCGSLIFLLFLRPSRLNKIMRLSSFWKCKIIRRFKSSELFTVFFISVRKAALIFLFWISNVDRSSSTADEFKIANLSRRVCEGEQGGSQFDRNQYFVSLKCGGWLWAAQFAMSKYFPPKKGCLRRFRKFAIITSTHHPRN